MTVLRAFGIIVASAVCFAVLGGLLGFALGRAVPGYYRSMFFGGNRPEFDPVAVGIGQGTTQGFVGGIVIGLLVVAVLTWYNSRQRRPFIRSEKMFPSALAEKAPIASDAITNRPASSPSLFRADTPTPPAGPALRE